MSNDRSGPSYGTPPARFDVRVSVEGEDVMVHYGQHRSAIRKRGSLGFMGSFVLADTTLSWRSHQQTAEKVAADLAEHIRGLLDADPSLRLRIGAVHLLEGSPDAAA